MRTRIHALPLEARGLHPPESLGPSRTAWWHLPLARGAGVSTERGGAHGRRASAPSRASEDRPGSRTSGRRCLTVLRLSEACRQAAPRTFRVNRGDGEMSKNHTRIRALRAQRYKGPPRGCTRGGDPRPPHRHDLAACSPPRRVPLLPRSSVLCGDPRELLMGTLPLGHQTRQVPGGSVLLGTQAPGSPVRPSAPAGRGPGLSYHSEAAPRSLSAMCDLGRE